MANKSNIKVDEDDDLSDLDFDDLGDFDDFGDFDFDEVETDIMPGADNRHPVLKVSHGFLQGVTSEVTDSSSLTRKLKTILPSEYGEAINLTDETLGTVGNLYNNIATETRKGVKDLKRASKKIFNQFKDKVPEKLRNKIDDFLETSEDYRSPSKEAMEDSEIGNNLNEVFGLQVEMEREKSRQDQADTAIRDVVENKRFKSEIAELFAIRQSINRMVTYQDQVTARYQRKSLELQYRHFFVSREHLALAEQTSKDVKEALQIIVKNTGLPDYRKTELTEASSAMLRDKFLGRVQGGVADLMNRNTYFSKIRENLKKKSEEIGNSIRESMQEIAGGMEMLDDNKEMVDTPTMVGQQVGAGAVGFAFNKLSPWLKKVISENPQIVRLGQRLLSILDNAPRTLNDFKNSDKGYGGLGTTLREAGAELLPNAKYNPSLETKDIASNFEETRFDSLTRKSVIEIIPGYLARIHQEIVMIRECQGCDKKPDSDKRLTYNIKENAFMSEGDNRAKLRDEVFKTDDTISGKDRLDDVYDSLGIDGRIKSGQQEDARKLIEKQLLKMHRDNEEFSIGKLLDISNYVIATDDTTEIDNATGRSRVIPGRKGESKELVESVIAALKEEFGYITKEGEYGETKYVKGKYETNHVKEEAFQYRANRLREGLTDPAEIIRAYHETGQGRPLEELGLINVGKDGSRSINMARVNEYLQRGGSFREKLKDAKILIVDADGNETINEVKINDINAGNRTEDEEALFEDLDVVVKDEDDLSKFGTVDVDKLKEKLRPENLDKAETEYSRNTREKRRLRKYWEEKERNRESAQRKQERRAAIPETQLQRKLRLFREKVTGGIETAVNGLATKMGVEIKTDEEIRREKKYASNNRIDEIDRSADARSDYEYAEYERTGKEAKYDDYNNPEANDILTRASSAASTLATREGQQEVLANVSRIASKLFTNENFKKAIKGIEDAVDTVAIKLDDTTLGNKAGVLSRYEGAKNGLGEGINALKEGVGDIEAGLLAGFAVDRLDKKRPLSNDNKGALIEQIKAWVRIGGKVDSAYLNNLKNKANYFDEVNSQDEIDSLVAYFNAGEEGSSIEEIGEISSTPSGLMDEAKRRFKLITHRDDVIQEDGTVTSPGSLLQTVSTLGRSMADAATTEGTIGERVKGVGGVVRDELTDKIVNKKAFEIMKKLDYNTLTDENRKEIYGLLRTKIKNGESIEIGDLVEEGFYPETFNEANRNNLINRANEEAWAITDNEKKYTKVVTDKVLEYLLDSSKLSADIASGASNLVTAITEPEARNAALQTAQTTLQNGVSGVRDALGTPEAARETLGNIRDSISDRVPPIMDSPNVQRVTDAARSTATTLADSRAGHAVRDTVTAISNNERVQQVQRTFSESKQALKNSKAIERINQVISSLPEQARNNPQVQELIQRLEQGKEDLINFNVTETIKALRLPQNFNKRALLKWLSRRNSLVGEGSVNVDITPEFTLPLENLQEAEEIAPTVTVSEPATPDTELNLLQRGFNRLLSSLDEIKNRLKNVLPSTPDTLPAPLAGALAFARTNGATINPNSDYGSRRLPDMDLPPSSNSVDTISEIRDLLKGSTPGVGTNMQKLVELTSTSTESNGEAQIAVLTRILETLEGIGTLATTGNKESWFSFSKIMRKTGSAIGQFGNAVGKFYLGGLQFAGGALGGAGNVALGAGRFVGNTLGRIFAKKEVYGAIDVFLKDKPEEAILKAKEMEEGLYFDSKTALPIKTVEDLLKLKGDVINVDHTKTYVTAAELSKGIYDYNGKRLDKGGIFSRILGTASSIAGGLGRGYMAMLSSPLALLRGAGTIAKSTWGLLNREVDIFVKGEKEPRLLATVLKNGGYFSVRKQRAIYSYKDIDGDIADSGGNTVLSHADLIKGLVDRNGRPLNFLMRQLSRVWSVVKAPFKALGWLTKNVYAPVTKLALKPVAAVAKAPFKLAAWAARKVLPTSVMNVVEKPFKAIGRGYNGIKSLITGKKDENSETSPLSNVLPSTRNSESKKATKIASKQLTTLNKIYKLLKERLPKPRSSVRGLWDSDGDGDRDGGWQDIFANRKKKERNAVPVPTLAPQERESKGFAFWWDLLVKFGKWLLAGIAGLGIFKALGEFFKRFSLPGGNPRGGGNAPRAPASEPARPPGQGTGRGPAPSGAAAESAATRNATSQAGTRLGGAASGAATSAATGAATQTGARAAAASLGSRAAAATAAGATVTRTALTTAARWVGTRLAVGALAVGTAGVAPVLGAAVAGVATGYAAYQVGSYAAEGLVKLGLFAWAQYTKKTLGPLGMLRMSMYGISADDEDKKGKILFLEKELEQNFVTAGGVCKITGKVDWARIAANFGLDPNSNEQNGNFNNWLKYRFLPIYFNSQLVLSNLNLNVKLEEIDDMPPKDKLLFLKSFRAFKFSNPDATNIHP